MNGKTVSFQNEGNCKVAYYNIIETSFKKNNNKNGYVTSYATVSFGNIENQNLFNDRGQI